MSAVFKTKIDFLYKNEYVMTFKLSKQDDGSVKVAGLTMFVDSLATVALNEALAKAKASS